MNEPFVEPSSASSEDNACLLFIGNAHVDDEHSSKEAVTCNKLKTLDAVICTGSRWRGIAVEDAVIEYMTKYATKSGQ